MFLVRPQAQELKQYSTIATCSAIAASALWQRPVPGAHPPRACGSCRGADRVEAMVV